MPIPDIVEVVAVGLVIAGVAIHQEPAQNNTPSGPHLERYSAHNMPCGLL